MICGWSGNYPVIKTPSCLNRALAFTNNYQQHYFFALKPKQQEVHPLQFEPLSSKA